MLATYSRRLRTLLAAFLLPLALSSHAQIIIRDPAVASSGFPAPSLAQRIAPLPLQLATHPDGTSRLPIAQHFSINANPFEASADFALAHPDFRWHLGAFAPLDIDLELPSRGMPWPIGRTHNNLQALNGIHHDSNGPQGVNWFQVAAPEIMSADNDRLLFIVWGADRVSTFARFDSASDSDVTIYRGVNGTAGAVEHLHGTSSAFRYTDDHGARAVFFGDDSAAPRRLWYISDTAGRTSFVGSMQSLEEAIALGYGSDGLIDLAFDSAGRRYDYSYSSHPIGNACRLVDVTVTHTSTFVARVAYSYYMQTIPGAGLAGDLKSVATTLPLSDPSKEITYRKHYRYWTESWSSDHPGHPHSIRMIIEPEGVRRATIAGSDPDVVIDTNQLSRWASQEFEYDESRRIIAFKTIGVASSSIPGSDPSMLRNTVQYEAGIGGTSAERVVVSAEGHFTTMYFDADGQQLSVVKSLTHPATASEFKIFETTRDQDGFVIYRGTPRAAAGYQHLSGQFSRRESGGLALLTTRVPTGVYRGFVASQRIHDGGLNVAPLASYSYLGESDASLAVSMGVGGGGEYEIYRPLIAGVTRFEDVEGSSPLTTALSYRMDSELAPRGSPLAVRIVTQRDPVVTRDRHGDGAPRISHMMLDHDGTPLLRRFPSGRIDAISRDDHGLITSTIKDCDPLRLPAMPMLPEFQPDIGAIALHRVTRFEYDLQGRLRASVQGGLGSNAERRHELYRDVLADGRMVRFDIPHVDAGFCFGPAEVSVLQHNGRISASLLIGFPGAEFTLAASRTDVAPAHWIAEGAIGIDSIIGPADSRRAMLKVEHFDPTGEHRIRADTYTNIPETMPGVEGVNYRAARSRFLRGIVVERIDEQGTIDETTIDDFGRVMSCSRTTVGSGRPPFTLAAITYDNGEISGNDDITGFVQFGGSSPDRITSIARDWRGRVVSVSNPTAPHEVYSYDNLNRVTAVGLYGGAAVPLGASNPYAANSLRRALVATAFDQSGAIYKTSEYEINQHTGDVITIEGQAQALVTDRWHSPDGWLVAWTGTSDGRKRFNRIGEVTDEFVTVEAESMSYEVANAEPMPAGVITHRRLIRDPMTGDILAEILAEKSAATPVGMVWNPCAPNAWPLIPPSFMSGQFGSNINICNDANAGGFSHPMQVNSFVYDPLGRVIQKTKWGDPAFSRARGGDGCIPFGGTSAPIDGTSIQAIGSFPDLENTDELSRWDDVYPRTESLARNRFGLPSVVAGASGRATVIEYDDALRPVSEAKRLIRGGPMFGGVGDIAFSACEQEPPVRREYDGLLLKALLPSREQMACEQAKYERKYELDPLIWAEFMSDVPDASAPSLLSAKPDDNADCISLSTDDWVVKRDGFGEVVRSRDPAGNISDIIRDGAGRPVRLTITPGHGGAPTVRDFVYDDLGRGIGVVQQDETNGNTGSIRVFGLRGALINGTQYIESRGPDDVLRGMPDAMTCYSTRIRGQGWNGVETHLASFPGGLSERYGPSECHASLDGAIGRNGVIEVFESDGSCAPGSAPAWLRMNVPYHGIANPAWFDVQPESSTGLSGTSKLLRVAMVATPEDVGANPTNEYNEPRRDFICAGIAGVCSTPLVDQEISRDPDGKILDVKDHVIEDSGRRVFYMDCTRAIEQFEGLFTRGYGESGGNFEEPDGAISRERVSFDRYGNVASYQAESAGASRELVNVANGHNQIVASEPAVPAEIEYDANGNLIRDGRGRRYEYDVENNLIRVFESAGQDERIVARFWYDGERRRIAAAYNDNSDGDAHTDAAFDNERIEHYAYDDLWRLRAVFVRDPESETAIWRERYVYDAAGINGRPTSARLDSPVAVQYNDDEDDDAERTSLIIANHLGDVIRLHHDDGTSIDVRYSLFGEPRSESFFADFNQDGAVDGDDVIVFFERWDAGDASADTDRNGSVDGDDVIAFFTWWDSGKGADDLSELRFGFRGYVRDSKLGLYHVRHRVYDPRPVATGMRWLQRDPAFFVDGMNLYGYCRGDPVNGVDPYGLDTWWVGDVLRSAGYAGLGDYTDDIADGGAFIFDMVEAIGDNPAAAAGPAAQNAAAGFVIAGGMTALSATGPVGATVVAVSVVGMSIYTIWYVHELALRWDQMSPESQAEAAGGFFGGLAGAVAGGSVQGSLRSRPSTPGPTRPATQYVTMPRIARHGELSRELRGTGSQSNHLSQDASYRNAIPTKDGLAMALKGDAIRQPGTQHFEFHRCLEEFWQPYRTGALRGQTPTNAEYLVALYTALRALGYSDAVARGITEAAAAQQIAYGLTPEMAVPRVPSRLPQRQ